MVLKGVTWGVPENSEKRKQQIEIFEEYLKNNGKLNTQAALQFFILIKEGKETIYSEQYNKVVAVIVKSTREDLNKALDEIYLNLDDNAHRIKSYIEVLPFIAFSFIKSTQLPIYKTLTDYAELNTPKTTLNPPKTNASKENDLFQAAITENNNCLDAKPRAYISGYSKLIRLYDGLKKQNEELIELLKNPENLKKGNRTLVEHLCATSSAIRKEIKTEELLHACQNTSVSNGAQIKHLQNKHEEQAKLKKEYTTDHMDAFVFKSFERSI